MDLPSFSLPRFLLLCVALLPTNVFPTYRVLRHCGKKGSRASWGGPGGVSRQPTHTAARVHLRVTGRHVVVDRGGWQASAQKHTWIQMPIHMQIYYKLTKSTLISPPQPLKHGRIMSWDDPWRSFPGCPNGKATHDSQNHSAEYYKTWVTLYISIPHK